MANTAAQLTSALTGGDVNVGKSERLFSTLGGGILALAGLKRGGVPGALLGVAGLALLHRGTSGHCMVYGALDVDTSEGAHARHGAMPADGEKTTRVEASLTLDRPADEAYALWRDVTQAPRYMHRILSVDPLGGDRSRWMAEGVRGRTVEWISQITEDVPGRRIAWESLPGSDLPNRGSVEFTAGTRPGETVVRHVLEFDPPGGVVGQAIAGALQELPQEMVKNDLRRFKALLETGEIFDGSAPTSGRL